MFGFCLYAMLTFMSCISLLLYLEQCVYIYKKLPYSRKTTIIWINGAAPVSTNACLIKKEKTIHAVIGAIKSESIIKAIKFNLGNKLHDNGN